MLTATIAGVPKKAHEIASNWALVRRAGRGLALGDTGECLVHALLEGVSTIARRMQMLRRVESGGEFHKRSMPTARSPYLGHGRARSRSVVLIPQCR